LTGNDLIVEIPWIIFALFMAVIGIRLRRSRRLLGRRRGPEARQPSEDRAGGSAASTNGGDTAGNDHQGAAQS
jgi:hypothetical protein